MSMLNIIYDNSPVVMQNLFCSIKGYLIYKKRYNNNFHRYLEKFERRKYDPISSLKIFLQNISTTPFYKQTFRECDFNVNAQDIYVELKKLPIITKDIVKEDVRRFINSDYKGKSYESKTSGTTGGGLIFPCSLELENKQWAVWWRYRRWYGMDLNMWQGWFGGRSIISIKNQSAPYWRINIPGKQVMFSAYHLNNNTIKDYYNEIVKRQLKWLHGYPSQISLLSSIIFEHNLEPLFFVTYITFGAENLFDYQKEIIQTVFPRAKLCQHYGLSEGVANISEDINGNFVIDDDFCYIEFIPFSTENKNICKIIGTGFCNEAFPLIRYDTGDIAEIDYLPNGGIKILSIDGRKEDFIFLPNGVKLGRLDHIFKGSTAVKEAQIHQKDLYHIDFNIVKGIAYTTNDENELMKEIRMRIDDSVYISINYVDKIERTKSGKLRFVISDIKVNHAPNNPRP
ncbi:capsular polysaccharide biosynthesis protein CapK [Spirochaetia bacterium]|nr:capsular polysaccharide biosynthesis protein CapK [Spirochaetia bacterium]